MLLLVGHTLPLIPSAALLDLHRAAALLHPWGAGLLLHGVALLFVAGLALLLV